VETAPETNGIETPVSPVKITSPVAPTKPAEPSKPKVSSMESNMAKLSAMNGNFFADF
jgi:hypothetical protein